MKYVLNCVSWNSLKEIFHSVSSPLSKFSRKFNFKIFENFKMISFVYCFDLLSRHKIGVKEELIFVFLVNVFQINSHKRPCTAKRHKRHLLEIFRSLSILFNCLWIFTKFCTRLTLILQKKMHEVASSYFFKERTKYASASINSCKIPQNVFLQKLVQWKLTSLNRAAIIYLLQNHQ